MSARWTVIGAPIDSAAESDAEVLAPAALRAAGPLERIATPVAKPGADIA